MCSPIAPASKSVLDVLKKGPLTILSPGNFTEILVHFGLGGSGATGSQGWAAAATILPTSVAWYSACLR